MYESFEYVDYDEDYEDHYSVPKEVQAMDFRLCMLSSSTQISSYLFVYILVMLAYRITTLLISNQLENIKHCLSCFWGIWLLVHQYNPLMFYVFYTELILATYFVLKIILHFRVFRGKIGHVILIFCVVNSLLCELIGNDIPLWNQIRGPQMLCIMKLISIAYDLDRKVLEPNNFNFVSFIGYIICPANSIFGPWCSYTDYRKYMLKAYLDKKIFQDKTYYLHIMTNTTMALLFLLSSNCLIPYLIPDDSWKWFTAFRDALAFRNSHYFVMFLSQSFMVTSGFLELSFISEQTPGSWSNKIFGNMFVEPLNIELPRSLVSVVTNWNLPMHYWLKTYIFRRIIPHGSFLAICCTYFMSSLLHGLSCKLSLVLITLGVATYYEYILRTKLANIFNMCILSKKCKMNSRHQCSLRHFYRNFSVRSILVNVAFSFVTILNLTYLGVIFNEQYDAQENESSSYIYIFDQWGNLNFLTHVLISINVLICLAL